MGQNIETMALWLRAKYYISNCCPVPIKEHLIFKNAAYAVRPPRQLFKPGPELNLQTLVEEPGNVTPSKKIQLLQCQELSNPILNSVVALANETARAGYDALIFCSSRAGM
jgi:hypothetical protein